MSILDIIIIVLIISWIGGFSFRVAGGLIHILLVLALVGILLRLLGVVF